MAAAPAKIAVRVQREPFDQATEICHLSRLADVGAVVSFTGICRADGGRLAGLELEHYPGMAEAEIGRVAAEAAARWPILGATAIHRFGRIAAGEDIVLVVTASAHRAAAFAAAEFLMDWLKTRAPFWKREIFADGTAGAWVEAKDADDAAAARW
ncbi:molybdopterin synthase subunit MoaE [Tepidamorphus gemmatus]|uniref:Molybdopterin synthase catalytic subunit n=1 Tax=Tepidamorphus gemmatus TaxID=747076 RepID=A0A4V2V025_9HYPH|nr:molybdenum cofactor biosynthesis protein MoaE [Tepidamorphus gemmatus]TCT13639.1 molybdopterin synthase subunit MoaE [Tepidamorphus gemmatus]